MNHPDDESLRDPFAALRREDAAHAPSLDTLLGRAGRRHTARAPLRRLAPAIGVVAVSVLLALVLLRSGSEPQPLVSLADARWQSPTDFLLRVPGAEYLESVPSIGRLGPVVSDSLP